MHKIVNGQRVELTAEEIAQKEADEAAWQAGAFDRAIAELRSRRNQLLASSDWTQLPDVALVEDEAWEQYRADLRNLTDGLSTADDVAGVTWPTAP
tara:strand:+ start:1023 stop:1310 length:288 start_codon:yes stop_codon:yes gene_type:complete